MRVLAALACCTALAGAACGHADRTRDMDVALRDLLQQDAPPTFVTTDAEGRTLWSGTQDFYQSRDFGPAWIEAAAPTPQMDALIEALHEAAGEGLDPDLYSVDLIRQKRTEGTTGFLTPRGFEPGEAATLDVWLTYIYLKYAVDLADGVSDLPNADPNWHIQTEPFDPVAHLQAALDSGRVSESLTQLLPTHREYRALRDELERYREIAADGGWPMLPSDLRLSPGATHEAVPLLEQRLSVTGDYAAMVASTTGAPAAGVAASPSASAAGASAAGASAAASAVASPTTDAAREDAVEATSVQEPVYAQPLAEAVMRFQARHGLPATGRVDAATLSALNVPVEERMQQIVFNLERWRWLPRELGERYILVNVPEMRLRVYEGDDVALAMRVVVGTRETQTPIFNDQMSYLVFSPYWNVPDSIAQGETLPAALRDPSFLGRNNMEIIDKAGRPVDPADLDEDALANYRFRQRPGATNALGLVKFMFPNKYDVYLHDTPADSLFTRASRAFSHGCVRLEEPVALAEYVLRDQPEWDTAAIQRAMDGGTERTVKLTAPLPVYLGYWTASVDEHGVLQFLPDIYGIDAGQQRRLSERLERLRGTEKPAAEAPAGEEPASDEPADDEAAAG